MIHSSYMEELNSLLHRIADDPQRQGLCADGKELKGETEHEELYLDFSYQKLDEIGYALFCLEQARALEETRLSPEEWQAFKHSFVLSCLSVSGGRPSREDTIKKAYEQIKETLTHCVGTSYYTDKQEEAI